MFSERSTIVRYSSALTEALSRRRESGASTIDLTICDPSAAGIRFDEKTTGAARSDQRRDPLGLRSARAAIAAELARERVVVDPSHIVLTASVSEAYVYLFALLCDPGDEVLVPAPCDPLLARIAHHSDVSLASYELVYDGSWRTEASAIWESIGERTRAIVAFSPGIPTGAYLTTEQTDALAALGVPLIVDERLAPYPIDAPDDRVRAANVKSDALVFVIDGLGKRAPFDRKLEWVALSGRDDHVHEAIARLSQIAEAHDSLSTPEQSALEELLSATRSTRDAVIERIATNLELIVELTKDTPLEIPRVEGGFFVPVRVPAFRSGDEWALALLDRGILVMPGSAFDFPDGEAWLVLSLLASREDLERGIRELSTLAARGS